MTRAYDIANAAGRHSGFLKSNRESNGVRQIELGINSLTKRIQEHTEWMANPWSKIVPETPADAVRRYVVDKWPADVKRQIEERDVLIGLLKEMKDGAGTGNR